MTATLHLQNAEMFGIRIGSKRATLCGLSLLQSHNASRIAVIVQTC